MREEGFKVKTNQIHKLEGWEEARELLKDLDRKTRDKIVMIALRKSSKPIVNAAKNNIRGYSKTIASSIRARKIRRSKMLGVSIKPGGEKAWYAHFVEFGTSGIVLKAGGYTRESDKDEFKWVGMIPQGGRYRKDQPARPFMRPAIDSKKNVTKELLAKNFKKDIEESVKKHRCKKKS